MGMIVCEWGLASIAAWADRAAMFVIVDVLSFSTGVSIAVDCGASVIPFPYGDTDAAAAEAARLGSIAAQPRLTAQGRPSLSPASLRQLAPGDRLLLPSPNGSALSRATGQVPTLCGCLRNAAAVGDAAQRLAPDGTIVVIAVGERWPDNSLRPAIEDWLGAGAIIAGMSGAMSAEARLARQTFEGAGSAIGALLRDSISGRELAAIEHAGDVEVALELGSSTAVPLLGSAGYTAI